nr:hypothetical protein [Hyphomonas sp. 34-62-18]
MPPTASLCNPSTICTETRARCAVQRVGPRQDEAPSIGRAHVRTGAMKQGTTELRGNRHACHARRPITTNAGRA